MKRKNKLLIFSCIVFFVTSGLIYGSRYPFLNLDLPMIKADSAHQIDPHNSKNYLIYDIRAGEGFLLDTSEYKKYYAEADTSWFSEVRKIIRFSGDTGPESVDLVPGRDLYQICPHGGLRSGDKISVEIAEEAYNKFHYNFSWTWSAYVRVK